MRVSGGVRFAGILAPAAALVLVAAGAMAENPVDASIRARLTARELADPLEPWSLEPGAALLARPAPPPAAPPVEPVPPSPTTPAPGPALADTLGGAVAPPDTALGAEEVLVVRCRQLLVDDPQLAARLGQLLRSGAALESARAVLGSSGIDERVREYALGDLAPDVAAEVESLPAGAWSRVRPWRGRSLLFQVQAKERRQRRTIPALGRGLGAQEEQRLASRYQIEQAPRAPVPEAGNYEKPVVVTPVTPQFPEGATGSGEVRLQVELGMADDVVGVRVLQSTDPVFDEPALRAARQQQYRTARRDGVPVQSTLDIQFRFVAPEAPVGDGNPPGTAP